MFSLLLSLQESASRAHILQAQQWFIDKFDEFNSKTAVSWDQAKKNFTFNNPAFPGKVNLGPLTYDGRTGHDIICQDIAEFYDKEHLGPVKVSKTGEFEFIVQFNSYTDALNGISIYLNIQLKLNSITKRDINNIVAVANQQLTAI